MSNTLFLHCLYRSKNLRRKKKVVHICIFIWSEWILENSVNKTMYTANEVCIWYVFIN